VRRVPYFAALALALALVAGPVAGAPGEPTAPVTNVTLALKHYGTGALVTCVPVSGTTTWAQLDASSTSPFPFAKMRIEGFAQVQAVPSEHWRTRLIIEKVEQGNGGKIVYKDDSYYDWRHQNVPTDGRRNWEIIQASKVFTGLPGFWRITLIVDGDESLNHYAPACVFEVG